MGFTIDLFRLSLHEFLTEAKLKAEEEEEKCKTQDTPEEESKSEISTKQKAAISLPACISGENLKALFEKCLNISDKYILDIIETQTASITLYRQILLTDGLNGILGVTKELIRDFLYFE